MLFSRFQHARISWFTLLLIQIAICANGQITFQKTYDGLDMDWPQSVTQTSDGGYIFVGDQNNFSASGLSIVKTNELGDTLWKRVYIDIGDYARPCKVLETSDGNYAIATGEGYAAYLLKISPEGDFIWAKTYYDTLFGGTFTSFSETDDGGFICIGGINDSSFFLGSIWIVRTDPTGNILWSKVFSGLDFYGICVAQTNDGGYIMGGREENAAGYFPSLNEAVLIRTDSLGNILWAKSYGDSLSNWQRFLHVRQLPDGGFIACGTGTVSLEGTYLVRTDSAGNVIWSYGYNTRDIKIGFDLTTDGGFIASSYDYPDDSLLLIKIRNNGEVEWANKFTYPIYNFYTSVQQTSDGGYILLATAQNSVDTPFHRPDFYLIKTDAAGHSGCYESPANVAYFSAPALTSNIIPLVSSYGTQYSITPLVAYGCKVTTLCINVAIEELEQKSFASIYPNPFSTSAMLYVPNSLSGPCSFILYDLFGREVMQVENARDQQTIERGNLTAGIYVYRFLQDQEIIGEGKVVIQ